MAAELVGLEDFTDALKDVADVDKMMKAMMKCCALVERTAKEKAPKGKGELRRSITSKVEVDNGNVQGVVYTPLEYAPYVEYGTGLFAVEGGRQDVPWCYQDEEGNWHSTSGQHPQPFLNPALDECREEIIRILKGASNND